MSLNSGFFLKSWSGFLPWRSEQHHPFVFFTDASSFRWAGVLNPNAVPLSASDYWSEEILSSPIAVKEAFALSNALSSFASTIKDSRVVVYSSTLFHAWNGQSARSHSLSEPLKSIFEVLMSSNCILRLFQVPSVNNLADRPSRSLSLADSRLSASFWKRLQDAFGGPDGHSVDLIALPSNVMRSSSGAMLPFFSPHATPCCSGVNLFSQSPDFHPPRLFSFPYVFPPICLFPNLLRFLSSICNLIYRRSLSLADSRLSASSWKRLQDASGGPDGHSVDLIALPSNVMRSSSGAMLPFFSPHATPGCSGVNLFSQSPDFHPPRLFSCPYVFPPICLFPNLLRFLSSICNLIYRRGPGCYASSFLVALLPHCPSSSLLLARKGQVGVLHPPSNNGYQDSWPLPWDLWAFRIEPI